MFSDVAQQTSCRPGFYTLQPGRVGYDDALQLQKRLLQQRLVSDADVLVLLEHQPVITCGRNSSEQNLLASAEQLASRGISLRRISRGGDITYHGPGQLIGYPIIYLAPGQRDLHRYLRKLEQVLLRSAASFGVDARTVAGKTGLWVGDQKLASIGVGVRRWVTWHGFALNVQHQLEGFAAIVPCGLSGVQMTSLEECLGRPLTLQEVETVVIQHFAEVFSMTSLGDYEQPTTTQT